jgi:hypothetical protein
MTTDQALRDGAAAPPRTILTASLLLGIASIVCLKQVPSTSILFALSLGVLVVCLLPPLVALRDRLSNKRYPEGGRWMTTVAVLLWTALLIGPLVAGSLWAWTRFRIAADGMARPYDELGAVLFGFLSFSAAYWFAFLAILIQLWRGQWHAKLTAATMAFLFLFFVVYVLEMSAII